MTDNQYIALCAHHPESNHLPSPHIWPLLPLLPFTTPLLHLITIILLSESMSFINSSNKFSASFSPSSLSETPIMKM